MFITLQEGGKFAPGVIKCKVTHNFYLSTAFAHIFFRLWKDCFGFEGGFYYFCCRKETEEPQVVGQTGLTYPTCLIRHNAYFINFFG